MHKHTARAIAYLAARMQTGKAAGAVYDFTAGKYTWMSGTVTDTSINIYDHDRGCHL